MCFLHDGERNDRLPQFGPASASNLEATECKGTVIKFIAKADVKVVILEWGDGVVTVCWYIEIGRVSKRIWRSIDVKSQRMFPFAYRHLIITPWADSTSPANCQLRRNCLQTTRSCPWALAFKFCDGALCLNAGCDEVGWIWYHCCFAIVVSTRSMGSSCAERRDRSHLVLGCDFQRGDDGSTSGQTFVSPVWSVPAQTALGFIKGTCQPQVGWLQVGLEIMFRV